MLEAFKIVAIMWGVGIAFALIMLVIHYAWEIFCKTRQGKAVKAFLNSEAFGNALGSGIFAFFPYVIIKEILYWGEYPYISFKEILAVSITSFLFSLNVYHNAKNG